MLFAGNQLVNGIQCVFSSEGATGDSVSLTSPQFSSSNDQPAASVLDLDPDDCIVRVSARCGALVDSVSFTTRKGKTLSAGGSGGNLVQVSGCKLVV